MKTKSEISGYIARSAVIVVVLSSAIIGFAPAFYLSGTDPRLSWYSAKLVKVAPQTKTLTFTERVAYQQAIEEVYWHHRIWPKERPDPKPSLDAVISQAQLENKVADYLGKFQAVEDYWQRPLSVEQLQAEMNRMAQHTRQPEVLRELFEALGNDPFVIAECLVRPVLTERLIAGLSALHQTGRPQSLRSAETHRPKKVAAIGSIAKAVQVNRPYHLPIIASPSGGCIDDTWTATSTINAPDARAFHTAVWTGSEMIIWGGSTGGNLVNTGGRYNPSTDSWTVTGITNAPSARYKHTAVWTGSEMIVWGGHDGNFLNTGGRYNPNTDSWTATSTTNAPSARDTHTAVWTGSEMIIWGGFDASHFLNTGGRYDPSTDSWTATSTTNAPVGRESHTAVWTRNSMIIWGGFFFDGNDNYLNTGGRYSPDTNSWTATTTINAPAGRDLHTAVWTGSEMIVWGGFNLSGYFNTGGRYNPSTDNWTATSTTSAPDARVAHTAVWTGNEMVVWGGADNFGDYLNTGGRYDPGADSWTATSTINAPRARAQHTAVSTNSEMIVWGGADINTFLNTGGRYCAQVGLPTPTPTATASPTPTPTPITTPSATPGPCQFRVLIAYADISGQPDMLRNQILAEPEVIAVDLFDAFSGTPTLQQLQNYDVVFAFSNNVWNDAIAMGNLLADYEDGGGVVVVGTFAWDSNGGWLLQGRWVTGGYSPYNSTNQQNFTCDVANIINPSHPLMRGVSSLNACVRNGLTLASGASAVALWTDVPPAVAYKTNNGHTAVGINAYLGHLGQFSGEFGRVIVNAGRWLRACEGTPTPTPTATATATATPTATPSPTPRTIPTPRPRPTPAPRP